MDIGEKKSYFIPLSSYLLQCSIGLQLPGTYTTIAGQNMKPCEVRLYNPHVVIDSGCPRLTMILRRIQHLTASLGML